LGLPPTIRWVGGLDGHIELVDQTLLPEKLQVKCCQEVEQLSEAIRSLRIRGAPALGVAGAMGVVLGAARHRRRDRQAFDAKLAEVCDYLAALRPTAVNLGWAVERMRARAASMSGCSPEQVCEGLLAEADSIRAEDQRCCEAIGLAGQPLVTEGGGVLTHCHTGALATCGAGTALAVLYEAHRRGRRFRVYADETRPLLQGARLTAWELMRAGLDVTLICDSAAGSLMAAGQVDLVLTGADRIAGNGDTANKVGTYSLAVLARSHGIPFYVAAPTSSFDLTLEDGSDISIEQRPAAEVRGGFGRQTAPAEVRCHNAAFDVTPAELISGIVTDRGVVAPVGREAIGHVFSRSLLHGGN